MIKQGVSSMVSKAPSSLLLSSLPNYQELFNTENRELISHFNVLVIRDLYNHANISFYLHKYQCDYLLPADLTKSEANSFIKHLKEGKIENSSLQQELIDRYKKNLWDKIGSMFEALDKYRTNSDDTQLKVLESEAHKIAGSGASYGFKTLGDISHQLDVYFQEKHSNMEKAGYCENRLRKMLFAFQKIET
jgi:HPt (histidine-containing phosphotransfer) domain-containing protein